MRVVESVLVMINWIEDHLRLFPSFPMLLIALTESEYLLWYLFCASGVGLPVAQAIIIDRQNSVD